MKLYSLDFSTVALRFYLMMGIIIGAFFIGYPILAALSLPIFFITMIGLKFSIPKLFARKQSNRQPKAAPQQNIERAHQHAH